MTLSANVKMQELPCSIMVSVCSEKEARAEVMGLSDVEEKISVLLRTSSSGQEKGQHLHFSFFPWLFDRELLLGPDERFWWAS